MTKLFVSGVPKNDCFQFVENGLVQDRLISIHPDYCNDGLRYLDDLLAGINSLAAYEDRYGDFDLLTRERRRRRKQEDMFDTREYCLRERLSSISLPFDGPESIIVDSGAFTDWTRGRMAGAGAAIRVRNRSTPRLPTGRQVLLPCDARHHRDASRWNSPRHLPC